MDRGADGSGPGASLKAAQFSATFTTFWEWFIKDHSHQKAEEITEL